MARGDIKAGAAYVELYVKRSQFNKAMEDAQKRLQAFGSSLVKVGAGIAGAGTAVLGSLAGAVSHFAGVGDALDKMSLRTGISASALAELGFAAEQSGTDIGAVENGVRRMQRTVSDAASGLGTANDALAKVGLSAADLQGLSPEEQFTLIGDRVGQIEDPTLKAAAAMEIFGRSGTALIPMLGSVQDLRDEAKDLGLAPSPESVKAAAEITDAINRVRRTIGAAIFEIGAALAPMAKDVLAGILSVVRAVQKWIKANKPLFTTIAKVAAVLVATGSAIMAVGAGFIAAAIAIKVMLATVAAIASGIGLAVSVFGALSAVIGLVLSPVGLLVVALLAAGAAVLKFTDAGSRISSTVGGAFSKLMSIVKTAVAEIGSVLGSIWDAVKAGDLELAGQIAMTALRLVVKMGIVQISKMFGDTFGKIGSQLLEGDLSGAWNTVVLGMTKVWTEFSQGVVESFTAGARLVIKVWRDTVNKISNMILQKAAEGGVFGAFFEKTSGVNVQEEIARSQQLEAQRQGLRGQLTADRDEVAAELGTARGGSDGQDEVRRQSLREQIEAANMQGDTALAAQLGEQLEALQPTGGQAATIAMLESQLAALERSIEQFDTGPLPDIFDQIANGTFEGAGVGAQADAMLGFLDQMEAVAAASNEAATAALDAATEGTGDQAADELAQLRQELVALQERAATKAEEAAENGGRGLLNFGGDGEGQGGQGASSQKIAGFSAAALQAQSRGAAEGREQKVTDAIKLQTTLLLGGFDQVAAQLAVNALHHP